MLKEPEAWVTWLLWGWGKSPQNCQRALISLFGKPLGAPEFTWCEIETKRGKTLHPFLLPHAWFSSLCSERPEQFESAICGPAGARQAFWAMMADTPFVKEHPALIPDDRTIPVGIYGDAGAFSKQDSLMIFTWNSLLGIGSTMEKKFLATCINKSDIVPATYAGIFSVLAWSFNVMLTGVWPEVDWLGRAQPIRKEYLANGYRGCLTQVRGDWEYYCSIFSFPKWNEADRMCWMCDASSSGPLAFSNCSHDAPWRATRHTHESYMAMLTAQGKPLPSLFAEVVGLRLECVSIDVLHACDLGFAAHVLGNVFFLCCRLKVFDPGNMEKNIEGLDKAMRQWYSEHTVEVSTRIKGKLTRDRVKTSGGWPKLKAKGAMSRHVVPFALELARSHLDAKVVAVCQQLCSFYQLLATQGMFLDATAKSSLPVLGRRMCGLFAQLSAEALANRQRAWKMTPKVHLMMHLCEWQAPSLGNPRFWWTYSDEDLVGSMVEAAKSCHASTMAPTAMVKWQVFAFESQA